MNVRIMGIFISVFIMLFSPALSGMIFDNYKTNNVDELDKSELEAKEISLYINSTGEKRSLDFEEYICGVIMAEVPSNFNEEALKAMAVAVRSYCMRRIDTNEMELCHFSADVCDNFSHCLGFVSYDDAVKKWGELTAEEGYQKIKKAVKETEGEILRYDGVVADTVFHSSSGKCTESAKNLWGFDVPYLVSVSSPEECACFYTQYDSAELSEILENEGIICSLESDPSKWMSEYKQNENGRCESVLIGDTVVTGRRMREIFGLKSTDFEISYSDGVFTFTVVGYGHGVGMSQYGCNTMAEEGDDYREILSHYYPGTLLSLY